MLNLARKDEKYIDDIIEDLRDLFKEKNPDMDTVNGLLTNLIKALYNIMNGDNADYKNDKYDEDDEDEDKELNKTKVKALLNAAEDLAREIGVLANFSNRIEELRTRINNATKKSQLDDIEKVINKLIEDIIKEKENQGGATDLKDAQKILDELKTLIKKLNLTSDEKTKLDGLVNDVQVLIDRPANMDSINKALKKLNDAIAEILNSKEDGDGGNIDDDALNKLLKEIKDLKNQSSNQNIDAELNYMYDLIEKLNKGAINKKEGIEGLRESIQNLINLCTSKNDLNILKKANSLLNKLNEDNMKYLNGELKFIGDRVDVYNIMDLLEVSINSFK